MKPLVIEKQFDAEVETVFDRLTDFASAADRIEAITKIEMLTEGAVGVGTKFKETRIMFGREASEVMWIDVFERPSRFVLGAESNGARYRTSYELTPHAGGTKLLMTFAAEPVTWGAKILGTLLQPMMAGVMKKAVTKDLDDLASALSA